ncbi:FtsJ-domain-containing protein [Hortaea werneckii]|nr:FtsJ-domain-containing protein [Hortaea werneckii]KAI7312033.1 FtsJ-domain-containing protein [Hortaea werneckii]
MLTKAVARLPTELRLLLICDTRYAALPARPNIPFPYSLSACPRSPHPHFQTRSASSASSSRWKTRQSNDSYAREAKVAGLKSRAAFKLLEINDKYRLFRPGDTVVDLGYAPGSWSQVALNRTQPGGRVVGIDIIPAQPPRGVSTLQGDFLSVEIREELKRFVVEGQGRPRRIEEMVRREGEGGEEGEGWTEEELDREGRGVVELERASSQREGDARQDMPSKGRRTDKKPSQRQADEAEGRVVNVVLSDMCEPWPLVTSSWIKSDLCHAALTFAFDTLSAGGNFLCKFYQGEEDKALELRLKKLFDKTYRIKPDSSRKESKEAYLVGLRRKAGAVRNEVLGGG